MCQSAKSLIYRYPLTSGVARSGGKIVIFRNGCEMSQYAVLVHDRLNRGAMPMAITDRHGDEDRFQSLFDHSIDAVLLSPPDGAIEAANAEACHLFGCTEQEICAVGIAGLVDLTDTRFETFLEERERTGRSRG